MNTSNSFRNLILANLFLFLFVSCNSENKVTTFCNENYPIIFEYPQSMDWNEVVGLAIGDDHYFFNIGFKEINEKPDDIIALLNNELKERNKIPDELSSIILGKNEVAIATFQNTRSEFEIERGLFTMTYEALTVIENKVVTFTAFQNTDNNDDQVLTILKEILESVQARNPLNRCNQN